MLGQRTTTEIRRRRALRVDPVPMLQSRRLRAPLARLALPMRTRIHPPSAFSAPLASTPCPRPATTAPLAQQISTKTRQQRVTLAESAHSEPVRVCRATLVLLAPQMMIQTQRPRAPSVHLEASLTLGHCAATRAYRVRLTRTLHRPLRVRSASWARTLRAALEACHALCALLERQTWIKTHRRPASLVSGGSFRLLSHCHARTARWAARTRMHLLRVKPAWWDARISISSRSPTARSVRLETMLRPAPRCARRAPQAMLT